MQTGHVSTVHTAISPVYFRRNPPKVLQGWQKATRHYQSECFNGDRLESQPNEGILRNEQSTGQAGRRRDLSTMMQVS